MATIRDVARVAAVSIATVSATLNGSGRVSAETRKRIWATIETVGYHPNAIARSLRLGRSRLIGMVVSDITNPFAGQLIRAAEATAFKAGFSLIVCTRGDDLHRLEAVLTQLCAQQVAGIVLSPPGSRARHRRLLERPDLPPLVTIDHKVPGLARDFVGADNPAMVALLVEHLVRLGHRHIVMVSGRRGVWTADERCRGFLEALGRAGLNADPARCIRADYTGRSGFQAARRLLVHPDRPTAVIGANNTIALGILEAVLACGLVCPADIAIAGIDEVPWSGLVRPRITVVTQPVDTIAATAMEWLLERILQPDLPAAARERLVAPTFIEGESCARREAADASSHRRAGVLG